uniref:Uncharacterized protein n=1 Tax=Podoviridae sp. ct8Lf7 TaxID=2827723 RepID=A0A8S5S1P1_9CAUD|nr:MAG TPA: hypothetical protein [Podoviridae sp. ct8Lf7]
MLLDITRNFPNCKISTYRLRVTTTKQLKLEKAHLMELS